MTDKWKIPAGFALVAFIFSFFVGLFSGVSFGIVLLRSFLGSAVFSALGFGIQFLAEQFLPELFEETDGGGEVDDTVSEQPELAGGNVDITVPDHNPHEKATGNAVSEDIEDDVVTELVEDATSVEEIEPVSPELSGTASFVKDNEQEVEELSGDEDSMVEEIEEETPDVAATRESIAEIEAQEESVSVPDVDSLPDMGNLADSFVSGVDEDEGSGDGSFPPKGDEGSSGEGDPATMAKAIQTLLKKGQEG